MAVTKQRFDLKTWIQFGGTYIYPNQHDDEKYMEICSEQLDRSMRNFLIRFVVMLGAFAIGMSRQMYANIFMGMKTTCMEVKIPYTDEKSNAEFAGNMFWQSILLTYAFFGYIGMKIAMEMVIVVMYTRVDRFLK